MKERPILMSAPMVRACLREVDPKTQTRRMIKLKTGDTFDERALVGAIQEWRPVFDKVANAVVGKESVLIRCPYGVPGDRLWVRESGLESLKAPLFRTFAHDATPGRFWVDSDGGRYGASYGPSITRESTIQAGGWKIRPSIHMPRWACRLVLEVTEVRVERLQDISEADAIAEGAEPCANGHWFDRSPALAGSDARGAYYCLWGHINGPDSWDANPWVWVVSFKRVAAV